MTTEELIDEARETSRMEADGGDRGLGDLIDRLADALEGATATIEAVKLARGSHPVCKRHPVGDFLECGWKTAVLDIDAVLGKGETE